MTYAPPAHLAIVLSSDLATDRDVAFWVEAVRLQLREHAAPAWGLPPPGVFVYSPDTFVPAKEGAVIALVSDDGNDDAAGVHGALGNVPYGLVDLKQSTLPERTLSHEALELWANAALDRWAPGPGGLEYALELCDPCQRDDYLIGVTMFGEERAVEVSDFVTPMWFGMGPVSFPGGCTYKGRIDTPFNLSPGGYAIARDQQGRIRYLSHAEGAFMEPRKLGPRARTRRLIEAGR